jgi:hypothetical protein
VIADHRPQIIHLLSGHIHRAINSSAFDLPASSCPSTAHQVALDFVTDDARFSHEAPGFQLHRVQNGRLTTYTASLDRFLDDFDPARFRPEDQTRFWATIPRLPTMSDSDLLTEMIGIMMGNSHPERIR